MLRPPGSRQMHSGNSQRVTATPFLDRIGRMPRDVEKLDAALAADPDWLRKRRAELEEQLRFIRAQEAQRPEVSAQGVEVVRAGPCDPE